jgi:DNA-binding MarR family transcriptional regulator
VEREISNQHDTIDGLGAASGAATSERGASELATTELASEIEFLTARARSIGIARANAALAPLALRVQSYSVLALACSDRNPSQRELAEFLVLDPSQIVALVDQLEKRRLVIRETNSRDRRSKGISATTAGRKLYAEARAIVREAENHSLKMLRHDEQEQLRVLLQKIAFEPRP